MVILKSKIDNKFIPLFCFYGIPKGHIDVSIIGFSIVVSMGYSTNYRIEK